jgi:hypothetical protein
LDISDKLLYFTLYVDLGSHPTQNISRTQIPTILLWLLLQSDAGVALKDFFRPDYPSAKNSVFAQETRERIATDVQMTSEVEEYPNPAAVKRLRK